MKRYEFIFEKSFFEEPIKGRVIELGDESEPFEPIITINTFCYKIFLSDKPIEELQQPFELPEYFKEKTYYFGTVYTVDAYTKRFPKVNIEDRVIDYSNLFNIIQASPVGVPFCFPIPVYKYANIEVIDYKKARKVNVTANGDIVKKHKTIHSF
ncbi:MAG: hypothetical protein MJ246_07940 [Clostridia bacterium]|nr:hypothetical protein [Clostridia bacterium]